MREISRGVAASAIAVSSTGESRMIMTLFDVAGTPIGHAELGKRAFDRLLQAARDVRPGPGFGELSVTFETSEVADG